MLSSSYTIPLLVLDPIKASISELSSSPTPPDRSNALLSLLFPLLVVKAGFVVLKPGAEAFCGDSTLFLSFSGEKSSLLLTGLFAGGCEVARVGVPLFKFLDGEDIGPTERGMDLRGDELRCVLIGDVARGGRLILPSRTLLTASVGSGIVPAVRTSISKVSPGISWQVENSILTLVYVHGVIS